MYICLYIYLYIFLWVNRKVFTLLSGDLEFQSCLCLSHLVPGIQETKLAIILGGKYRLLSLYTSATSTWIRQDCTLWYVQTKHSKNINKRQKKVEVQGKFKLMNWPPIRI